MSARQLSIRRSELEDALTQAAIALPRHWDMDVRIDFDGNRLKFTTSGAEVFAEASGNWQGTAIVSLRMLAGVRKRLPGGDPLNLRFDGGRFYVERWSIPGSWRDMSPEPIEGEPAFQGEPTYVGLSLDDLDISWGRLSFSLSVGEASIWLCVDYDDYQTQLVSFVSAVDRVRFGHDGGSEFGIKSERISLEVRTLPDDLVRVSIRSVSSPGLLAVDAAVRRDALIRCARGLFEDIAEHPNLGHHLVCYASVYDGASLSDGAYAAAAQEAPEAWDRMATGEYDNDEYQVLDAQIVRAISRSLRLTESQQADVQRYQRMLRTLKVPSGIESSADMAENRVKPTSSRIPREAPAMQPEGSPPSNAFASTNRPADIDFRLEDIRSGSLSFVVLVGGAEIRLYIGHEDHETQLVDLVCMVDRLQGESEFGRVSLGLQALSEELLHISIRSVSSPGVLTVNAVAARDATTQKLRKLLGDIAQHPNFGNQLVWWQSMWEEHAYAATCGPVGELEDELLSGTIGLCDDQRGVVLSLQLMLHTLDVPADIESRADMAESRVERTSLPSPRAALAMRPERSPPSLDIDPEILLAVMTLAVYHIERGTRTFAAYSKAIIDDVGEKARPYLRMAYEGARYNPDLTTTGMTSAAEIDAAASPELRDASMSPNSTSHLRKLLMIANDPKVPKTLREQAMKARRFIQAGAKIRAKERAAKPSS